MFAKSFYFSFGDKKLKKKDTTNIQFYYKHHRVGYLKSGVEVWKYLHSYIPPSSLAKGYDSGQGGPES